MKALLLAATLAFAATSSTQAGSFAYIPPESTGVEAPMASGTANWLVPLAIIAIIVLVASGDDDDCRKFAAESSLAVAPCVK
ncbi:MAG: hypothetical protein WD046_07595 [Paracoccaceae bacterium]